MKIYKYPLQINDTQTVMIPKGAKLLTVQMQHGSPQLWASVDPNTGLATRRIACAGTGHHTPDGLYLGTIQMQNGALIFHFFDQGEQ